MTERYTHEKLRKWGEALDQERPKGLGETLLCYANDWRHEVNALWMEKIDCRTCTQMHICLPNTAIAMQCTNGDRYEPLPRVVLWNTPSRTS